jgi:hypothetical protein
MVYIGSPRPHAIQSPQLLRQSPQASSPQGLPTHVEDSSSVLLALPDVNRNRRDPQSRARLGGKWR